MMGRKIISLVVLSLLGTSLVGCSKRYQDLPTFSPFPLYDSKNYSAGRFKTSYLADQIHAYYLGNTSGPIAVATLVDVDNLYAASTFGRLLSEQIMSELTMRGYRVIELRKAHAMQIMFAQGEFGLSRETAAIRDWQEIAGLVVGTYAVSPDRVYVNIRLLDPSNSTVISAGSVEMGKSAEITRMLRSSVLPPSLERIPVKHLGYASYPVPYHWPYMPGQMMPGQMMPGMMHQDLSEDSFMEKEEEAGGTNIPAPPTPTPTLEPNT